MNREAFEQLAETKKKAIEKAYFAAYKKEIAADDFFAICRRTLTESEFSALFTDHHGSRRQGFIEYPRNTQSTYIQHPPHSQGTPYVSQPIHSQSHPQAYAQPAATAAAAAPQPQQDEIKTEHIEDIMQYTGVNLKEEAEQIAKEAEHNIKMPAYEEIDNNIRIESLFNTKAFREFVVKTCNARSVKITDAGLRLLFMVMKRKLLDFTGKLDQACRIRTEAGLLDFSFRVDEEVSKQMWYLNEMEKAKLAKLLIDKDEESKKKKVIQEREDLLIKNRLSNSVAMAAMGVKNMPWMVSESERNAGETAKFSSIYTPYDEKGLDQKIRARTIGMRDYLFVLERDKRYNKSIFLIQHYFK